MTRRSTVPVTCDITIDSPAGPPSADAGSPARYTAGRPGSTAGSASAAATPPWWVLVVPAPGPWLSANDRLHWSTRARLARAWRNAVYLGLLRARPPKGLARLRLDLVLLFADRRSRDTDNYRPTAKPVVDAFGPPFVRLPRGDFRGAAAPGYGVVPDDDLAHLDGPHLHPGGCTWADYARTTRQHRHAAASRLGGLVVVATDLSRLPAGTTWVPPVAGGGPTHREGR